MESLIFLMGPLCFLVFLYSLSYFHESSSANFDFEHVSIPGCLNQSTGDAYTHAAILACASAVKRSTAAVMLEPEISGRDCPPWAVDLPMLRHILDHIAQAFPFVVPWHVSWTSPNTAQEVGPWTVRRQPQHTQRGDWPPRLDGFGCMETVVISYDRETRHPWRWVCGVQQGPAVPKHSLVFARPKAIQQLPGWKMPCPCESVLLVLPWCHALSLRTVRHPAARPWGGGAERVHPHRPSSHALVYCHDETACARTARSGAGQHLALPVWPFPAQPSRGASGARFPLTPRSRVWPGAALRGWHNSTGAAPALWTRGSCEDGAQGAQSQGMKTVRRTARERWPSGSTRIPRLQRERPARSGTHWSVSKTARPQSPSGFGLQHTIISYGTPAESHRACGGGRTPLDLLCWGISRKVVDGTVGPP